MINGGSLLLKPKESVSAFYFILTGEVARLANTRENVRFLKKYLISKKKIVKN
jgi:hypothetical protein